MINDLSDRTAYPLGFQAATAINNAGTTVAGWGQINGIMPNGQHAVAWINGINGGKLTDLGVINGTAGATYDQANGVNDSGVIVGTSNGHAFIWDNVNKMRDMNTVFASIIPANWTLLDAYAIDNNGDIVGYGSNNGTQQGFLLTPALPGDANLDGKVDINDLTRVLTNYNQTTGMGWGTGDFNNDGKVDINDLTIVLTPLQPEPWGVRPRRQRVRRAGTSDRAPTGIGLGLSRRRLLPAIRLAQAITVGWVKVAQLLVGLRRTDPP